ncbi:MAG: Glu/Leu/Phe/Val dehydrogenase dimerization domain-containing protein [bacterium]
MAHPNFLNMPVQEFVETLKSNQINRFYFIYDQNKKEVIPSHQLLKPIAEFIQNDKRDFNNHEGMFFQITKEFDTLQGAFIHRTNRGQAAGGIRYWNYDNVENYLRDGLRLSMGMTLKNALAGLWWGGGKGVMSHNPDTDKFSPEIREYLYKEYGKLMTSLQGCYVTAEDVGTNVSDMANIFSNTRFTTCIPPTLGGSGNPSVPTARGIVSGMEAALNFLEMGTLENKVVAIQGIGNVGTPLIKFLLERNISKIICGDINESLVRKTKDTFGDKIEVRLLRNNDLSLFSINCDIFSPNATGAILNPATIPLLNTKIICGAANNQLEDYDRDDQNIFERGILYVPDFLTNRMGIVNCADEQYGYINHDPFFERHLENSWEHSIYQTALKVFTESKTRKIPPSRIASKMADELSLVNHPITGHRGIQIIQTLHENNWANPINT